jgi:DNA-binding PadR family transcriptional regulator
LQLLILLTLLVEPKSTGYHVTEHIRGRLGKGVFKISAGTIYPQLSKLEEYNLLESRMEVLDEAEIRPDQPRKVFVLTQSGVDITREIVQVWDELVSTVIDFQEEIKESIT